MVRLSKLNSLTTFKPDRSEKGKNFAKKSKILPQKTVFWLRDKRRNKSMIKHKKKLWKLLNLILELTTN